MIQMSKCHAKINLYLKVLGKRPDGYHDIQTLFQEIDLHDELSWEPGPGPPRLRVQCDIPGADFSVNTVDNFVHRAAKAFEALTGKSVGGSYTLKKRIPWGGGLGGGSSDAAATLRLLNHYHHRPLSRDELANLASQLGSDVPFFLIGGSCLGEGRGERLQPAAPPACPHSGFLLFPPFQLATAAVYGAYRPQPPGGALPTIGENDLLPAALRIAPELAACWKAANRVFPQGLIFMTGSGSTLVWLTRDTRLQETQARVLDQHKIRWSRFAFKPTPMASLNESGTSAGPHK